MARSAEISRCHFRRFNVWATGFNASWELDFWGRYRRLIESTNAAVDASMEGYNDTLVMLLAEVATNYVQMRTFEERLDFARHNVEIQKGSLQAGRGRFSGGVAHGARRAAGPTSLAQTEADDSAAGSGPPPGHQPVVHPAGHASDRPRRRVSPAPIPGAGASGGGHSGRAVAAAARHLAGPSGGGPQVRRSAWPRPTLSALSLNGFLATRPTISKVVRPKSFMGFVIPTLQWNVLNYGRMPTTSRAQDARLQACARVSTEGADRRPRGRRLAGGVLKSQEQAANLGEACTRPNARSSWC